MLSCDQPCTAKTGRTGICVKPVDFSDTPFHYVWFFRRQIQFRICRSAKPNYGFRSVQWISAKANLLQLNDDSITSFWWNITFFPDYGCTSLITGLTKTHLSKTKLSPDKEGHFQFLILQQIFPFFHQIVRCPLNIELPLLGVADFAELSGELSTRFPLIYISRVMQER